MAQFYRLRITVKDDETFLSADTYGYDRAHRLAESIQERLGPNDRVEIESSNVETTLWGGESNR